MTRSENMLAGMNATATVVLSTAQEVLTVPAHSIGKMIADSKLYMETIDLFAWTLVVIMISLVIEKVLVASIMTGDNNTNQKADGYDRIK